MKNKALNKNMMMANNCKLFIKFLNITKEMILEIEPDSENVNVNKRKPKIGFNLIKQKQNRCIERYKKHHT